MEQVSDLVLFQRIREDDRLALNVLFETHYTNLCRFACTFSVTAEQAEEIVADVFFTLWKNRSRLMVHSNGKAYLFKAVKNGVFALLKQQHREVKLSAEHDQEDLNTPEQQYQYQELEQHINRIVASLPYRCQQIFVMNRFDGLKYKEISQVLGLSEKTVEHQMTKALSIIRAALQGANQISPVHNSVTVS